MAILYDSPVDVVVIVTASTLGLDPLHSANAIRLGHQMERIWTRSKPVILRSTH